MTAPTFRVKAIELYERPVVLRIPFRFGGATLTHAPQAFVRVRIAMRDGREMQGAAAEMMVPKWFDKSPEKSNADNISDLRSSLLAAAGAYLAQTQALTAFGHFAAHYAPLIASGARAGLNPLSANYGAAVIDRAILDALCRACDVSFYAAIRANLAGITTALTTDLGEFDVDRFLDTLVPSTAIAARHTVGLLDALDREEASSHADDPLPVTLDEVIAAYGNRYFKLKLNGDARADVARLVRIATVLDRLPEYAVTLDGNEQYADRAAIADFLCEVEATPALAQLAARTIYLEQPLSRTTALDADMSALGRKMPLLIDESDSTLDVFPMAKGAGYAGVSSKSCKGIYKSILNAARCAQWNAGGPPRYFLSGEDLTMQAGVAVQQDLALAAGLGLRHVERNGHHYVDGFSGQGAGNAEQQRFLASQPGLYEASHGSVRLAIRDGMIDLASLDAVGFAACSEPDWTTLEPMTGSIVSRDPA